MTNERVNVMSKSNTHYNDEIVISGIAGRFPHSDNVQQLKENLMNKIDLLSDDDRRWKPGHPEIPQLTGKINNLEKFDSSFFAVHAKQAQGMDPSGRMLLEHAYEAIVDAGVNPRQLRGTKTGVFIGTSISESDKILFYEKINGFGVTGCCRAMLANRISYWLGINGPSYTIDSACSSSITAMENAYDAIRTGKCEAALVGGANLCLHPAISLQFARLGSISPDGPAKVFDADANGYARSETVGLVFLQKAKDAKRIYATFVHGKINCDGFKEQGITFPSSEMQSILLKEFYDECGIPSSNLSYFEAHGTGTIVGDPEELKAIESALCPGRKTPLKIGSVKSNLGHAESASGICSIAKVVIAMESGLIPPNINFNRPREDIKALEDGRLEVVTEITPWDGGYVGVNSFGFGGSNAHILLKSHCKEKINNGAPKDDLPRLVAVSGRTEEAAAYILKDLENRPIDAEYIRLYHDIHSEDIPGHIYRGYTIVGGSATPEKPTRQIERYAGAKRPIWYVFSGMGSQWPGMGTSLLRLPVFAEAIKKCDTGLKPRGIDIYDILTNKDQSTFDNILNSFVGIAAIQLGLVDLLAYIGIVPDKMIGHSVGELGCAYADGCITAEQWILAAYYRGIGVMESDTINGSMAAVGLGYKDVKDLCPNDIDVACHNGPDSSTISGPAESVKCFVDKLTAQDIFIREIPCSNIAFHSRYIGKAGPKVLEYFQQIIPQPKPRSHKWISSSVPSSQWHLEQTRLSSAEYHANNFLSPVLFEEILLDIPKDAVTIEISPHGLLQAILRRSLNPTVTNISLTQRGHENNVEFFLQSLGKLFNVGLHPQIAKLYPNIEFPVSRGTPMISPLVKWEHTNDWFVASYTVMDGQIQSGHGRTIDISIENEDFDYMVGHIFEERNVIPATGYLVFVWETFAMMKGKMYSNLSVVFEDVKFLQTTLIPKEGSVTLTLVIQKGSGRFEVTDGDAAVVTGLIRYIPNPALEMMGFPINLDDHEVAEEISSDDVYKELRLRGYNCTDLFRCIKSMSIDCTKGTITWNNNWAAFLDNMIQMHFLNTDFRGVNAVTRIQKVTIDTNLHCESTSENNEFTGRSYKEYGVTVAGGVEIQGIKISAILRRKLPDVPLRETVEFVAHRDNAETTLKDFITLSAHIALEANFAIKVKAVEIIEDIDVSTLEDLVSPYLVEILRDMPLIIGDVNIATKNPSADYSAPENITICDIKKLSAETAAAIVICRNLFLSSRTKTLDQLLLCLKDKGFLIALESQTTDIYELAEKNSLDIILEKRVNNEKAYLLRKRGKLPNKTKIITISNDNFDWIPQVKSAMKEVANDSINQEERIVLVSEKDFVSGLPGLVLCLRKEPGGDIIRGFMIQDKNAPDFSIDNTLYADQLRLDLPLNVLRANNTWGTYRHLRFPEIVEKPMYHVSANQLVNGDLSSLRWIEGPLQPSTNKNNLVRVAYVPVNFRDVMVATGKLAIEEISSGRSDKCPFGLEFSGINSSGHRVMGILKDRGFTNIVEMDPIFTWYVPEAWSLEDAATVPCAYTTCFYALYYNGKMKKGDKVLIHTGSGGVGQAAINLALREGCEVFTTVGTPEKRRFIRETFPQIDDDHIGNSRDTSFEQMIIRQTKGYGVDIVLNTLAEEKLQASVRCLANGGRFLELGKFDPAANNPLGMEAFIKEINFCRVMLDNLLDAPEQKKLEIRDMIQRGLDSGAIKPLNRKVFPKSQIVNAFRYVAKAKHIGKVLIAIRDKDEPLDAPIKALPRFYCMEDHSYIIIGGLGGVALELVDWLIIRGARNIVLTSRTGIKNGYQARKIALWRNYGAKIIVVTGKEASVREDCEFILKTAAQLGPVSGIFNLAAILKDALMENQTEANFEEAFEGKTWGTKRLDEVSRKLCPKLQHFVVFSSVICGRGNAGQSNYAMSNSVVERICEKRVLEGFPGLAIQWGAIGDVGLVADLQKDNNMLVVVGNAQQKIASCLEELDKFLKQPFPVVASMVLVEKQTDTSGGSRDLNIVDAVLKLMELKDLNTISTHASLVEIGLDSIMAVAIKQTLEREFEVFLDLREIRALTFSKLMDMAMKEDGNECSKSAVDNKPVSTS